jgi:hypothetical protein
MRALTSRLAQGTGQAEERQKARGFLHIARHGVGAGTMYVVTYHRLVRSEHGSLDTAPNREAKAAKACPMLAESAQSLIEMLEKLGVDFRLSEVRGALGDILRFGSANIPDLWLNDEEIVRTGLIDS